MITLDDIRRVQRQRKLLIDLFNKTQDASLLRKLDSVDKQLVALRREVG